MTVFSPMLEMSRSCSLSDNMFVHSVSTMVSTWYSFTLPTSGPRLWGEKPVRMKWKRKKDLSTVKRDAQAHSSPWQRSPKCKYNQNISIDTDILQHGSCPHIHVPCAAARLPPYRVSVEFRADLQEDVSHHLLQI